MNKHSQKEDELINANLKMCLKIENGDPVTIEEAQKLI